MDNFFHVWNWVKQVFFKKLFQELIVFMGFFFFHRWQKKMKELFLPPKPFSTVSHMNNNKNISSREKQSSRKNAFTNKQTNTFS